MLSRVTVPLGRHWPLTLKWIKLDSQVKLLWLTFIPCPCSIFVVPNQNPSEFYYCPGSTEVGQILRKATAGSGKKLSLELGGKSPFVVFDSADLDGTVEGVVNAIYFNQGQVKHSERTLQHVMLTMDLGM